MLLMKLPPSPSCQPGYVIQHIRRSLCVIRKVFHPFFCPSQSFRDIAAAPLQARRNLPIPRPAPLRAPDTRPHVCSPEPRRCPLGEAAASCQARSGSRAWPWCVPAPGRCIPRALGARQSARRALRGRCVVARGTLRGALASSGWPSCPEPPLTQRQNVVPAVRGLPCGRDGGHGDEKARPGRVESGHPESPRGSSPGAPRSHSPPSTPSGPHRALLVLGVVLSAAHSLVPAQR